MALPDINDLLDQLFRDTEFQQQWELNPHEMAKGFTLSESQLTALLDGDVDTLISNGLAERHVQQMRVSW
jgi:hypothetical protein